MAENKVVKITFEVDGIQQSVGSVEELQSALKGVETQADSTSTSVSNVNKQVEKSGKEMVSAAEAGQGAVEVLNEATGGLAGQFVQVGKGIQDMGKYLIQSFKSGVQGASALGKAVIATGIGALVVAVGLLVTYWDDIKGLISGVSRQQQALLDQTTKTVGANQANLDATLASEETLKAQGMTEAEIRDLKIKQTEEVIKATEAQLIQQEEVKKAQVAAAERNQKIAAGVIAFLTAPITILLGAVDKLTEGLAYVGVLEKGTSLLSGYLETTSKFIFDPEEVAAEGDKTIEETKKKLTQLKNTRDGYRNQANASAKQDADEARERAKELQQTLEDLRAENIEDKEKEAQALLEIERKRARAELVAKGANQELLLEFDRRYEQKRKEIADQFQAERDAKAKEEQEKALENRRIIDEALQQARLDSIENTFELAQAELEIQRKAAEDELVLAGATAEEIAKVNASYSKKARKLAKEEADYKKSLNKQVSEANLDVASQAFGAIAGLVGENTAVGKAAAIASTTIDTYLAAQKAYTSQLLPGDPSSPIRAAIAAGVAVAAGIANVAKIIATPTPGKASGGGTAGGPPTPAPIPAFNPMAAIQGVTAGQVAPGEMAAQQVGTQSTVVRAYVVDSEVTRQQEATRKIENLATL